MNMIDKGLLPMGSRARPGLGAGAPSFPRTGLRILVAEDNSMMRMDVVDMLVADGHAVDAVATGVQAVAAVAENRYDVVFMDVYMPEMDGTRATRLIRAMSGAASETPIVALTACAVPGDREHFLGYGMNDYVTKPASRAKLLAAIERVAGHPAEAVAA